MEKKFSKYTGSENFKKGRRNPPKNKEVKSSNSRR